MPRINRKIRVVRQNRVTRAQILELLLGPYGESVFASPQAAQEVWGEQQKKYSPAFAARWHAAQDPGTRKDFAAIAAQYARDVVAGTIIASKWTKLACERHLKDLERAQAGEWTYTFDASKAARACRFIELLPHVKGRWAMREELMVLQPWQVFIVASLFGWVKRDGARRFTVAYICVPRKNGKSQLAAGIGLYLFCCDMEFGAEVYSGATTEKQAHEVFRPAMRMMMRSKELAQALGVVPAAKTISRPEDGSRFEVVIGKPGDGASPHGGLVDEYHEHDTDSLVDTLRTGMGARTQPLLFIITTAGDNKQGPCKLLQDDLCVMLEKYAADIAPEQFAIIYTLDKGDSWTAVESLEKTNPNLDVSVSREFLVSELQTAIIKPRKQGVFRTKYQNEWVGALSSYFDTLAWEAAADPGLRIEDFIGLPCVLSGDVATKRDFFAVVAAFKKTVQGKEHFYFFPRLYLSQAQVDRKDAPHYKEWADQKHIRVHEGAAVDHEVILTETIAWAKQLRAREFAYDPYNADLFAASIANHTTAEAVPIDQRVSRLSAPMKDLDVAAATGRVHHDGNPVFTWMVSNVMAKEDANENVLPRKEVGREENKIDGAVAAIMAYSRVQVAKSNSISYTGLRSVAC